MSTKLAAGLVGNICQPIPPKMDIGLIGGTIQNTDIVEPHQGPHDQSWQQECPRSMKMLRLRTVLGTQGEE